MEPDKNNTARQAQNSTQQILQSGKGNPQNGVPAHEAAEADMLQDPDLNGTSGPDDGLDEGELAQLEGKD